MGDSGIAGLWLRLALVLVVAMLVGVGSVLLANRTLPKPVAEGHNSTLSPFLTCVALVYGPLLGFTVVVAWGHFSSAEANVAHEASTLTTMYRQTVGMPVPEQTQSGNCFGNMPGRSKAPKRTSRTLVVLPTRHKPRSPKCTRSSRVSNPVWHRTRRLERFSAS